MADIDRIESDGKVIGRVIPMRAPAYKTMPILARPAGIKKYVFLEDFKYRDGHTKHIQEKGNVVSEQYFDIKKFTKLGAKLELVKEDTVEALPDISVPIKPKVEDKPKQKVG